MTQAPTIRRPYDWAPNAAHSVRAMICLEYRLSSRARKWKVAHRMHVEGLANMQSDAAKLSQQNGWWDWRIVEEYDPRHDSAYRTELTAAGEQAVIPGCERNASPTARQLDLF